MPLPVIRSVDFREHVPESVWCQACGPRRGYLRLREAETRKPDDGVIVRLETWECPLCEGEISLIELSRARAA